LGLVLCIDGASFDGGVYRPGESAPSRANATYGGLSIGLGGVISQSAQAPQ
jgi:hypothetical protein